ncbi:MAG: hypothetical protein M0R77_07645 [Gammaproteobacteria bacterium]|nr:hypothetical protein [Gammaproteobacteria bacterium]
MYKLFIDDERFPIDPHWFVARNSFEAIKAIDLYGIPQEIAFDHDLGGQDTAIIFINWLEDKLVEGVYNLPQGFIWSVHSQNPIGAKNIQARMEDLADYFGEKHV